MLRHLLESAPKRQRTRSAAFISFAFHAALVGSAVAATRAGPVVEFVDVLPTEGPIYIPTRDVPRPQPRTPKPAAPSTPAPTPTVTIPVEIPTELPPVNDNAAPTTDASTVPIFGSNTSPGTPGTGDADVPPGSSGDGSPMWSEDVERPVVPLGTVRQPRYPEPLRTMSTTGAVTASFVVDTLGRVEPASFKALDASHPLFEQAVRAAVLGQRFRPAQWNGRRVRQLVQQQFVFRLDR